MDEETASLLAVAAGAFTYSMEMDLDLVEELLSGDWNLQFHGSLVCFMVPMSFINVRALVEGEIKKCVPVCIYTHNQKHIHGPNRQLRFGL